MKGLNGENLGEALFSSKGRINGWMYIFYTSATYIVCYIITAIVYNILGTDNTGGLIAFIIATLTLLLILLITIIIGIKRFHDMGKNGRNMFFLLVPFYNIIVGLNLLFKWGDKEKNNYGIKPRNVSKTIKIITVILWIFCMGIAFMNEIINRGFTLTG